MLIVTARQASNVTGLKCAWIINHTTSQRIRTIHKYYNNDDSNSDDKTIQHPNTFYQ